MEGEPSQTNEEYAKAILARTLEQLQELIDKKRESLDIAMPSGLIQVTTQTAEEVGGELHELWGASYPDLFDKDSSL